MLQIKFQLVDKQTAKPVEPAKLFTTVKRETTALAIAEGEQAKYNSKLTVKGLEYMFYVVDPNQKEVA